MPVEPKQSVHSGMVQLHVAYSFARADAMLFDGANLTVTRSDTFEDFWSWCTRNGRLRVKCPAGCFIPLFPELQQALLSEYLLANRAVFKESAGNKQLETHFAVATLLLPADCLGNVDAIREPVLHFPLPLIEGAKLQVQQRLEVTAFVSAVTTMTSFRSTAENVTVMKGEKRKEKILSEIHRLEKDVPHRCVFSTLCAI